MPVWTTLDVKLSPTMFPFIVAVLIFTRYNIITLNFILIWSQSKFDVQFSPILKYCSSLLVLISFLIDCELHWSVCFLCKNLMLNFLPLSNIVPFHCMVVISLLTGSELHLIFLQPRFSVQFLSFSHIIPLHWWWSYLFTDSELQWSILSTNGFEFIYSSIIGAHGPLASELLLVRCFRSIYTYFSQLIKPFSKFKFALIFPPIPTLFTFSAVNLYNFLQRVSYIDLHVIAKISYLLSSEITYFIPFRCCWSHFMQSVSYMICMFVSAKTWDCLFSYSPILLPFICMCWSLFLQLVSYINLLFQPRCDAIFVFITHFLQEVSYTDLLFQPRFWCWTFSILPPSSILISLIFLQSVSCFDLLVSAKVKFFMLNFPHSPTLFPFINF